MMKKLLSIATLMLVALMLNAQSWVVQNTGFTTLSRGIQWISAPTSTVVWATAYDGSGGGAYIREVCKSTNGGTNWTPIVIPAGQIAATMALSTISGINATTAFIAAFPTAGTAQGVYKTTNGGTNWATCTAGLWTNAASFIDNAGFWDANYGVACGDAWGTPDVFEIYTTTNGGTNWAVVPSANIPNGLSGEDGWTTSFFSGTLGGNKCAFFGTNKGRIYRTTNGGLNWTVAASGFSDCAGSIAFTDLNNGVAICNLGTGGYLGFARTTNGGVSWAAETAYTGTIYKSSVCNVPGRVGWYIRTGAATGESGSQVSFDYGVSWTEIDNVDQHTTVFFVDRENGWTGGFNTSSSVGGMFKFVPGSVGIDANSIERNELNVYPNPCTGNFSLINAENSLVSIYNATGSLVYQTNVNNVKSFSIDLTNQAKGMYIVQVKNSNGVRTQKVSIN